MISERKTKTVHSFSEGEQPVPIFGKAWAQRVLENADLRDIFPNKPDLAAETIEGLSTAITTLALSIDPFVRTGSGSDGNEQSVLIRSDRPGLDVIAAALVLQGYEYKRTATVIDSENGNVFEVVRLERNEALIVDKVLMKRNYLPHK